MAWSSSDAMKAIISKNFMTIVLFVLAIRLSFALFPSFIIDMNNWIAWSRMLGETGISKFYLLPSWTNYTPGFLYYLWLLGSIDKTIHFGSQLYPFLVKLPVIFADIGVGLLIYKLFLAKNLRLARFGFFIYTLNPVIIFSNSIWGQTDGLIALFLVLSVYFLTGKKNVLLSSFFWVIALFIKPQALLCLPILLIYLFLVFRLKKTALFMLYSSVFIFFIGLPFFVYKNPLLGLPNLILKMSNESPFTSVMAFNFWALVKGMWIHDSGAFLKITYVSWGAMLLVSVLVIIVAKFKKEFKKPGGLYFIIGLSYLAFFLFPTRVHERYILVSLPFLLISAGLSYSKFEFVLYSIVSGLSLINVYHPYAYYTKESFLSNNALLALTSSIYKLIAFIFVSIFAAYFFKDRISKGFNFNFDFSRILKNKKSVMVPFPSHNVPKKLVRYLLILVLCFAFFTRIAWLGSPKNEYFDEVYHAFTARQILNGNKMAWEWWDTPPEGFAYEWTHPPLAKLGMVLGMLVFGENAFGWRIVQAILGVGAAFLIYLIGREIFKDKLTGVLSAAVFSLDGLALVMSRIGMNDTYMLFFMLLSLYFFMKEKDFWAALGFGLALASKWSVVWVIPIFFILWLRRKVKFKPSIIWFLVIPPAIYFLTYLPMFLSGHNLSIWWEMQKQMWWYHTGLRATHPYTSSWWQWPFLIRPIYLYTSSEVNGMVSRIYAMGNPVVFWFGLLSVVICAVYAFIERNKGLALVVFSYFVFFVPWAASPRIMFLYHYLPSIPFLAIATGYVLRRNLKLVIWYLFICLLVFIYFYPHWAGLNIPLWLDKSYYWFSSWR